MDYFQGVVTDFLRAKRSRFVNTEYMINLDPDGIYLKDRHWYCDAVALDFESSTIHLCEITYSKSLHAVGKRLQAWCDHWPDVVAALYRDSALKPEWQIFPRVFTPESLRPTLDLRIKALVWTEACSSRMPAPIVTTLEEVLPWRYRSWNGKGFEEDVGSSTGA